MRVLLVEDERKVRDSIAEGLQSEGFEVDVADTGSHGFARLRDAPPDVLILDLGLPDLDGLDVLRDLRASGSRMPVLVLTARDALEERLAGLDGGADDYLVKPFAFSELLARVRALLRRGRTETVMQLVHLDLELDLVRRRACRAGEELVLTTKEFELLELLLRHAGGTVSRKAIAEVVWRQVSRATPLDNVIDVHMARLRRKVDDPFPRRLIRTVRGVGFQLGDGPA
ncbi:MAG: response regulator transcription factor [Planctomycetota bacterium]|nr:response regulator transcription factor [Planctomycetota bacterium]